MYENVEQIVEAVLRAGSKKLPNAAEGSISAREFHAWYSLSFVFCPENLLPTTTSEVAAAVCYMLCKITVQHSTDSTDSTAVVGV